MENSGNIGGIGAVSTEGTSPGCANDVILVGIPVVGCFGCTLCNEEFDRAARLSRDARERHLTPMTFVCSTCGRSDGNYLAATVHHGKCTGPRPEVDRALLPFPCTVCDSAFVSKRAMTQHKRHAHLTVRNEERLANLKRQPLNRVWSLDEENLVQAAEELGKWSKRTRNVLKALFPEKTEVQILNKWKALRRSPRRRANQDPTPTETVRIGDSPSQTPTSRVCGHGAVQELKVRREIDTQSDA